MTKPIRVIVCGSRDLKDREFVFDELDRRNASLGPFTTIIQGDSRGADRLAKAWAEERGIECLTFHANWNKYGLSAGPIRNGQMIREGKPDLVIAFPGKRGTADMARQADTAGIEVIHLKPRR